MRTLSLACALLLAAGPAAAAISVLGGGQAEECYHAARDGKADNAAVAACDMALNAEMLAPRDRGGTLINRGVVRLLRGEYAPARADFDAGIDMAPEIGEGWTDRGAAFLGERRYREALADINRSLALGLREPAKAYFNRAVAEEGLDDETAAYRDYQQALVLSPGWDLPEHELLRFTVTRR